MIPTTYRQDITVGTRTISIETGKLAKQADGAVIVRSGDTMVIVTACHAANPRVGIDFLPLTVDYREYTYASGRIPGRLLQARGQARREGSAHEPADRSADPAAVPGGLVLRDADRRAADFRRHRERFGRAGDYGRVGGAGDLVDAVREDDRRRARRPGRRRLHRSTRPTPSASRARWTWSSPAARTRS